MPNMKPLTLKNRLDISFGIILVIFFVLVYFTWSRAKIVSDNREIISETYRVNTVLEKILSSTIDIETGSRGYIITGQEDFLSIYDSGSKKLKTWQDSLEDMQGTDTAKARDIKELYELVKHKQTFSEYVIDVRKKEGTDKAVELISTKKGKQIMDSIRDIVNNYQTREVNFLQIKLDETHKHVQSRNILFIVFAFVTLALLYTGYRILRRNTKLLIRDHYVQQTLADELTFQNQQLNDFANITTHNLRSSAGNMSALIDMVDDDSSKEEYAHIFGMIRKVCRNLNDSLNELMEIIKIKRNTDIHKENLILQDVYYKVTETLQGDILSREVTITADFSEVPNVLFPKVYLESILQNLISNAIKYRHPERKPEVKIKTSLANGHPVLKIQDNGLGIDMQRHGAKLFGMYQMFHKNTDAKGIGLFLTKTQIENCGGTITAQSDGKSGTTFIITFAKT